MSHAQGRALPEVPLEKLNIRDPSMTSNTPQQDPSDPELLEAKTLKRKNFKQLSLNSPVSSQSTNTYEPRMEDDPIDRIRAPRSLRLTRQRPAPILNLPNHPSLETNAPAEIDNKITAQSGCLGLKTTPASGEIVSQVVSRPSLNQPTLSTSRSRPMGTSTIPASSTTSTIFNINRSNRGVDPEQHSSTDEMINQISNLDLQSRQHPLGNAPTALGRKRQTIISSISPTKSSTTSPLEYKPQVVESIIENQSSPIATTTGLDLRNQDLLTLKQLGLGNSGSVSKVLHIPSQKTMAKKIIHVDSKSVIQTQIIRELRILHECSSPYIIEFYGAFLNNNNTIVICMEYCNCGSLDKIVQLCDYKQFPLFVLKKLSYAILSGLSYLYTKHKIIHRDIKPNNVLMTHKGEFKLCDFGVSRELTNSLAMADTFVGTSMYMSPERIQGLNYGVKSDVWSMGLMLIELVSGSPVWQDDDEEEEEEEEEENTAFNHNNSSEEKYGKGKEGGFAKCQGRLRQKTAKNTFKGPEGILDLLQRIVNEPAPSLRNKINSVTKVPYDVQLTNFIDLCLIKNDGDRRSPWQLLENLGGFLNGVAEGKYDAEHKMWAKRIRKLNKEKHGAD